MRDAGEILVPFFLASRSFQTVDSEQRDGYFHYERGNDIVMSIAAHSPAQKNGWLNRRVKLALSDDRG